jgi:ferredoxin
MADKSNKNPENVPGKYYVDSQCINCNLCIEIAPDIFEMSEDNGYSFVKKQPITDDEIARADEALEGCPVQAIGKSA